MFVRDVEANILIEVDRLVTMYTCRLEDLVRGSTCM